MGRVNMTGVVEGGPETSGAGVFPAARFTTPLSLLAGATGKQFAAGTGILVRTVNSPSAMVALDGVGPTSTVVQGDFLYLKTDGIFDLEITHDDGGGGTTVVVVPVHGVFAMEFPTTKPLEGLRIQGAGKIEYLVTGPS